MTADEPVLRVLLRDLDHHPALLECVWIGVLANVYTETADWIREQADRGAIIARQPSLPAFVSA